MIQTLKIVGFDPSLRHWGIVKGTLAVKRDSGIINTSLYVDEMTVTEAVLSKGKQIRQNSLDLETAQQLCAGALEAAKDAQAIFVEVPVGSQSARAMASYGICVGVLGALRATGIPFYEVTPAEVKLSTVGKKTATKEEMIEWAVKQHPEAPWPTYKEHGVNRINAGKAEHMADACAAIYAGINGNLFKQMLNFTLKPAA